MSTNKDIVRINKDAREWIYEEMAEWLEMSRDSDPDWTEYQAEYAAKFSAGFWILERLGLDQEFLAWHKRH